MIVTICGSLRFYDMMRGYVMNRPDTYLLPSPGDDNADWLHRQKIDRADKILVFNVDGYIGPKTREEIEAAHWCGKEIEYLEPRTAEKKEHSVDCISTEPYTNNPCSCGAEKKEEAK